jgi:hypothetical protein
MKAFGVNAHIAGQSIALTSARRIAAYDDELAHC